jgi:hypothetical protein
MLIISSVKIILWLDLQKDYAIILLVAAKIVLFNCWLFSLWLEG